MFPIQFDNAGVPLLAGWWGGKWAATPIFPC